MLKLKCISILAMSIITQSIFAEKEIQYLMLAIHQNKLDLLQLTAILNTLTTLAWSNSIEYFLKSRHVQVLRSSVNEDKVSLVQRATRYLMLIFPFQKQAQIIQIGSQASQMFSAKVLLVSALAFLLKRFSVLR